MKNVLEWTKITYKTTNDFFQFKNSFLLERVKFINQDFFFSRSLSIEHLFIHTLYVKSGKKLTINLINGY